ncbi:MAG: glycosyltransferase [Planctomycetota bacterium]
MPMLLIARILLLLLLAFAAASWIAWFIFSRRAIPLIPLLSPDNNRLQAHEIPRVTVCIPARNEEDHIVECLRSVLAIDYPSFDVIVVDDRSTDGTPRILDGIAACDGRVTVIHNSETPEGWMGKCYALHLAAARARSPWLLFIDADTRHHPQCLRVCMREIFDHDLDVLSPISGFEAPTFWEKLLMPSCGMILMGRVRGDLTNSPDFPAGFLNGQFFLISRQAYDAVGGHEAVRACVLEDVAFAHAVKKAGFRIRLAWGRDILRVRMYAGLRQMLVGWSRIFFGVVGRKAVPYLVMCANSVVWTLVPCAVLLLAPFLILSGPLHPLTWLSFSIALLSFTFSVLTMRIACILSGVQTRYAFARPLVSALLVVIFGRALALALGCTPLSLRGTTYQVHNVAPSSPPRPQ